MGFDMYNMSDAISQGNARTSQVDDLNEQIRANNATKIQNSKDAIKQNVSTDKEMGLLAGIKDAVGEGGAIMNVQGKVADYQKAVAKLGEGGKPPIKPSDPDITKTPAGYTDEEWDVLGAEPSSKPAAAITTSEGTLNEGETVLSKGSTAVAGGVETEVGAAKGAIGAAKGAGAVGEELSTGARVAGGIGRAAGTIGALGTAGLDIAADFKSATSGGSLIAGDNIGEKIANIGSIGGAALDMLGFVPGFQLAGVIGAGLSAASGVLEASSEAVHTASQIADDKNATPPTQNPQVAQASMAGSFANVRTS
tara:strand:- start:8903 stop:9829 length:927 start_codon:yes stop_codon:yes gene_type:complete